MPGKNETSHKKEPGQTPKGKDNGKMVQLSHMINASRAFRTLPPEITMGKEYDEGSKED